MNKVHFIGIGGTGISAIALLLLERGWQISGTDVNPSRYFDALTAAGATTLIGHHPDLALQADVIVRSSAVKDDDPEVRAAREAGIPVLKRAEFLSQVIEDRTLLAISGSHGKTTTTGMLVSLLRSLGADPTFILGAEVKGLGCNAHAGSDQYFVIEADEYDNMFLGLSPTLSIVTNIEHDHPDFFPTPEVYLSAFHQFLAKTRPGGIALLCGDDAGVQTLLGQLDLPGVDVFTYGFGLQNTFVATHCAWDGEASNFEIIRQLDENALRSLGNYRLGLAGRHNILNATAALASLHLLGFDLAGHEEALASFQGTERRFEKVYENAGVTIINDYAHHPTQVRATLSAARDAYPNRTLWVVWEPHTFSRTERMRAEFVQALDFADRVMVSRIYAAREADDGFTPQVISDELGSKAAYIPDFQQLAKTIAAETTRNDVVLVLSAGKGPQLSALLAQELESRKECE